MKKIKFLGNLKFISSNNDKLNRINKKYFKNKIILCSASTHYNEEEIFADLLIVGVGIEPNTIIASNAGLTIDNGIVINEYCRTSDPKIYAAGDCVSFPYNNSLIRLESVAFIVVLR